MNNYFRITGYYPQADVCFIIDSFGKFNELYDFSSYLIDKGIKVVKARAEGRFDYGNIPKAPPDNGYLILRACNKGQPILNGNTVTVKGKSYSIRS